MKILSVITILTATVFMEAFIRAGILGWLLYMALVAVGVIGFCFPRGKHERRTFSCTQNQTSKYL